MSFRDRFVNAFAVALLAVISAACSPAAADSSSPGGAAAQATKAAPLMSKEAMIERGAYLVTVGGCNDCHTPWKMGPNGPEPDAARRLSGHPAEMVMPPAPELPPGPWIVTVSATNTAWSGPWGVSFTANLTPDVDTGLGSWTPENFVDTIRNARHLGRGRPILPPMPAQFYAKMTDEDLLSIFAYLQSLKPIANRVPAPIPPAARG